MPEINAQVGREVEWIGRRLTETGSSSRDINVWTEEDEELLNFDHVRGKRRRYGLSVVAIFDNAGGKLQSELHGERQIAVANEPL